MADTDTKRGSIEGSTPVQYLKGVGPSRAKVFEQLGVTTVHDLLEYYPRDWIFAPHPSKIDDLRVGDLVKTNYSRFSLARLFGLGENYNGEEDGKFNVVYSIKLFITR